jgi:hypothetical protein
VIQVLTVPHELTSQMKRAYNQFRIYWNNKFQLPGREICPPAAGK